MKTNLEGLMGIILKGPVGALFLLFMCFDQGGIWVIQPF